MTSTLRTLVASIRADLGSEGEVIDGCLGSSADLALFNGPNSICSQRARAVLAHHGLRHRSHTMNMFAGQTYLPAYVRLRVIGCRAAGLPLVSDHTGSTSAAHTGCDPAVVSTLVDWTAGRVVIDSRRICLHLDALAPEDARLVPPGLAERIAREIEVVDELPNYQLLVGRPPGEDARPASVRGGDGTALARGKVARCDAAIAAHAGDADLVQAYGAKRAKEHAAATRLFGPEPMRAAHKAARRATDGLGERLAGSGGPFLFGRAPTMADLFWGVALLRMENLGAARLGRGGRRGHLDAYLDALRALPALRRAVTDWPGSQF